MGGLFAALSTAQELEVPSRDLSVIEQIAPRDVTIFDRIELYLADEADPDVQQRVPGEAPLAPCAGGQLPKADKDVVLRDDGAYLRLGDAGPCAPETEN